MKWQLPQNLDPTDTVCVQFQVPNDPAYQAAFWGAILSTTNWFNWERDPLHQGAVAAARMRRMYAQAGLGNCPSPIPPDGGGGDICEDCDMKFQQSGCLLQVQCADGSFATIFDASLCVPNPAPGNNPPGVGPGQSGSICFDADASQLTPLPFLVSAGDTLSFTTITGAGTDGSTAQWYCVDGSIYFLGVCAGGGGVISGDPLNTTKHMALLIKVGTNYYPLTGSLFTVPSGVANQQPFVLANTSNVPIARGKYHICVTYTNNQAPPVVSGEQTLDFTLMGNPFQASNASSSWNTQWAPGTGWENGAGAGQYNGMGAFGTITRATTITRLRYYETTISGTNASSYISVDQAVLDGHYYQNVQTMPNGSSVHDSGTISVAVPAGALLSLAHGNFGVNQPAGAIVTYKIVIDYTGNPPF